MNLNFTRLSLPLFFAVAANAYAAPLCTYAAYTPDSLRYYVSERLVHAGIATIPGSVGLLRDQAKDELFLAKDGLGLGFLKQISNASAGSNAISILDSGHKEIMRSEETISACSGGLCRDTTITISINGKPSSLSVSEIPDQGVRYYIGDQQAADVTIWHVAFRDYVTLAMNQLSDSTRSLRLSPLTKVQRLTVALATDVTIAPYLSSLQIELNLSGVLVLKGRTNASIYNLIMQKAANTGLVVKPEVILDSSIRMGEIPPSRDLQHCVRR